MEATQFLRQQSLQNQINALAERPDKMSPVGSVIAFAGSVAPTNWLLCNGSSVSSVTYPELYAVIGTTYGGVDGNFLLPNLVEKFIQGATVNTLATTGGGTITVTAQNLPAHSHVLTNGTASIVTAITDHSHGFSQSVITYNGNGLGGATSGASGNFLAGNPPNISSTNSASLTATSTISGSTNESTAPITPSIPVVPSFLALNYIIYAGGN